MIGSNYYYNYRTSYCLIDQKKTKKHFSNNKRKTTTKNEYIFINETKKKAIWFELKKRREKPVFTTISKNRAALITNHIGL